MPSQFTPCPLSSSFPRTHARTQLDSLTFSALSIFAKESHPALSGGGRAKEGFSLNALLDRTVSPPGKRLLRSWCLQPSLDAEVLLHRHDAVGFLMGARAQTPELWKELKGYLKASQSVDRRPGQNDDASSRTLLFFS